MLSTPNLPIRPFSLTVTLSLGAMENGYVSLGVSLQVLVGALSSLAVVHQSMRLSVKQAALWVKGEYALTVTRESNRHGRMSLWWGSVKLFAVDFTWEDQPPLFEVG